MRKWHKLDLGHWYTTVHPVRDCAPPSRPCLWLNTYTLKWMVLVLLEAVFIYKHWMCSEVFWNAVSFEHLCGQLMNYVSKTSISINILDLYRSKRECACYLSVTGQDKIWNHCFFYIFLSKSSNLLQVH